MSPRRVVVVGGGVIGAATAYYLARAHCAVTVLDRGGFGRKSSHANCGYVCPSHVLPLQVPGAIRAALTTLFHRNSPLKIHPGALLRNPGWFLGFARRCNHTHAMAAGRAIQGLLTSSRKLFDQLLHDSRIECEWESKGLLFVFRSRAAMDHYAEVDHLLREQFDTPAERVEAAELELMEPALKPGLAGGWLYKNDAHLRPDRLMSEFRRVLTDLGVEVREHCEVTGFEQKAGFATAVQTTSGDIPADDVVLATGAWAPRLGAQLGTRVPVLPGKGYSITFPRSAAGPRYPMIFEEDRVAITPFQSGIRIGSTMEFAGYDETLNQSRLALLTAGAERYLREPPTGPVEETWCGLRPMTPDGLPLIGPSKGLPNVWLAVGHNMLGLSMAPATGKLIAEMLTGEKPHLDPTPYSATRF